MEQPHSSKSFPDIDENIICKGPCRKKIYASNSFLDHLQQAKRCRLKYTEDEISALQITSEDTPVGLVSYLKQYRIE